MRSNRMTTSMERVFKKLPDGLIREITLHYIHFLADNGEIISTKLDKTISGKLFKRAINENEHSMYGEVLYQFPDEEEPVRLIGVMDYDNNRYGRF